MVFLPSTNYAVDAARRHIISAKKRTIQLLYKERMVAVDLVIGILRGGVVALCLTAAYCTVGASWLIYKTNFRWSPFWA